MSDTDFLAELLALPEEPCTAVAAPAPFTDVTENERAAELAAAYAYGARRGVLAGFEAMRANSHRAVGR